MEVIVVIAVVGIMAAVGLSRMKSSPAETQRANAAHVVINDFRYAQEIAMTYGRSVRIDVETGLNLYSLKWHDTNEYLPQLQAPAIIFGALERMNLKMCPLQIQT